MTEHSSSQLLLTLLNAIFVAKKPGPGAMVGMGWHGVATAAPSQQDASFLSPLEVLSSYFCYSIWVAKEKYPEILVELNFDLCDTLESSVFPYICIIHLIAII